MKTIARSSRLVRGALALVATCLPTLVIVAADVATTAPAASAGTVAATWGFVQSGGSSSCSGGNNSSQNYANWVSSSTAPADTVAVDFVLTGGGGGGGDDGNNSSPGGAGGRAAVISGRFNASAGQVLWAKLGCGGRNGPSGWAAAAAGWAFGGPANNYYGGGGGGASILCQGTSGGCTSGTDVVRAVAGGGGGGGRSGNDGCTPVYAGGAGGSGTSGGDVSIAGGTGRSGSAGASTQSSGEVPTGGGGGGGNNAGGSAGNDLWKTDQATAGSSTTLSNGFVPTPGGGTGGRGARGYDETNGGAGGGGLAGGGGGGGGDRGDGCGNLHAGGAGGGSGSSWVDDSVYSRGWGVAASTVSTNVCDNATPFTALTPSTAGYGATAGWSGCPGYVTATWVTSVAPTGSAQTTSSATKGTALSISLANADADSDARTCSIVGTPTKGSVTLSGAAPSTNCTASYTANANTTGNDTFTYRVTDAWNMQSTTYTVTVPIGNRKPVGTASSQSIQRGTSAAINLGATDADNDTINGTLASTGRTVSSTASMPAGSSTSCSLAGACTVSIAANTPPGSYSFTWRVSDLVEASDPVTQTVVVANTTPTASAQTVNNVQRGRPASETTFNLVGSDPANGDALTYAVASTAGMPAGSTVSCSTAGACQVAVPADTSLGNKTFTFTTSDNAGTSAPATVTIGVNNTAPVANPVGALNTTVGASLPVTLNGTDFNGDTLTYNAPVTAPTKGSVSGSGSSRTYVAANGTKGADSFTYTVSDNAPTTSTAGTVSIFIDNTAPTANAPTVTVDAPTAKTFQLTGADVNADALTFAVQGTPTKGSLSCNAAGACTYTPNSGAAGADSATFVANDGTANSTVTTITFDVVPPAPTISGNRSPLANGNGWNNEPIVVSFTCQSDSLASCTSPITLSTDGAGQSASGTVVDTLGREASTTVSGINIDRAAPSLVGLAATPPNAAGWYKAPVGIEWTCTDPLSGIAPGACPSPSTTVGEGTSVTAASSVADRAGNQTTATSQMVQVDLTAPSTGVSSPPTWAKEDVTLALSASDALSGVAKTEYRIDGGAIQTGTAPVVTGQGVHTVAFWSTDLAGNVEVQQSVTVRIDTDAPSITGQRTPSANGSGWNRTDVEVTFTCTDTGGSAVATCSGPQSFTGEVDTSVTGTVTDNAGNSATEQVAVRIDRTAPTVTANVPSPNANGWFNAPVQVPFSCVDSGGSGVASCPDPAMFSGEGANQVVLGTATDLAGNEGSTSGTDTVSVDLTPPTISGAATTSPNGDGGYYGSVTVQWSCADALSGANPCPAPQTVSTEGVHVLSASVEDRAGNSSTAEVTIRIDHDPSTDPGIVTGIVTDAQTESPLAGVLVRLHAPNGALTTMYSTTTGTDGRYTFPAIEDGSYLLSFTKWGTHLQAWNANKANSAHADPITIGHGSVVEIGQALAPGYTLSGRLTSAAGGGPVSGATVSVSGGGQTYQATSDANGNYQVTGMVAGTRTATVLAYGYQSSATSVVSPGTSTLNMALTPAAGVGLKGSVTAVSPAGRAAPGAVIKVYVKGAVNPGLQVTTGSDGRYQVPQVAFGQYELSVTRAYNRWYGDVSGRNLGTILTIAPGCAPNAEPAWGDPCAYVANFKLPTA